MTQAKDSRQPVVEKLLSSSQPLVEKCQADVGSIEKDANELKERWDAIEGVLKEVDTKFPKMKEAVAEHEESIKPLEKCLEEAKEVLENVVPFGLDTERGEEQLNKIKVCSSAANI